MKIKKFIALLLALAIIFPQFSVFAGAEDTVTISELPNYSATLHDSIDNDGNGNNEIRDGATVSLKNQFYYVVDKSLYDGDVQDVDENKTYTITLPTPFYITQTKTDEKIVFEGDVEYTNDDDTIRENVHIKCEIGTYSMTEGENTVNITFKMGDITVSQNNVGLTPDKIDFSWVTNFHLAIQCAINEKQINADDNGKITIQLPQNKTLNLTIEELKPEDPIAPTLTKKVTKAMDNRGLASWEIVYTAPNQVYIENGGTVPFKLSDTLPDGLKFSGDINISLEKDGVVTNKTQAVVDTSSFDYQIDADAQKITITYNTQLTDEEFAKALVDNSNTTYTNTVKALDEKNGQVLEPQSANVDTSAIEMIISKKASDVKYHAAEGENKAYYTLDWEIVIDAHGKQLTELKLVDNLEGQAIIIPTDIKDNFEKLDMKIEYAEGKPVAPSVDIEQKDLVLEYNNDNSRVIGFTLNLKNYLGIESGKVDTTKKFKITYKTQVDESYLASLDPDKIEIQHFRNTVSANFKFGEMTEPVTSNPVEAMPEHTIDPLITIVKGQKTEEENKKEPSLALKWNVTINPPRNITGAEFNMTEILFEDTFAKIKSCPDATKQNDYLSFGWNKEKRNEQIENIREQIEQQFTKGSNESLDITLTEDDDNYILNVKLKNTGTKPITFSYYTYGTNPYIWGGNMNQNFLYKNYVRLVPEGTKIDGQEIPNEITASASQNAGGGTVLSTWPLKYYYVSEKKIDWEIWVNAKGSPLGDIKLTDILPEGVSYIEGSARISDKGSNYTEDDFTPLSEQQSETENYVIHNAETGELDFYLKNISSKRSIRFSTTIDYEKLGSKYDETVNLKNEVNLYVKLYEGLYPSACENAWVKTQSASETAKIKNNVLQKTSNIENDTKVNYKVIINPLGLELLSDDKLHLYIEDKLDDGLAFDEESVRLYKAIVADQQKTSGDNHTYNPVNITKGEEITNKNLQFDSANNKMTLELPETNIAYIVEYTAYITRKNVTLNNNVKLVGSSVPEVSNQDNANHSVRLASHSGATLRPPKDLFYSVVVKKTGENNAQLAGATIGLYSKEDDESSLLGVGVSDENGNCIISVKTRLVSGYDKLYVREITAPDGYLLNRNWFEFAKKDGEKSNESSPIATIQNQQAKEGQKGKLTVYRYDKNTLEPLVGAKFALFSYIGDEQPEIGVTNMRGLLTFDGLTENTTYYIKEIEAPKGYPIDEQYKELEKITVSLETVIQVKSELSDITFTVIKQDSENQTPLSGAEFAIYEKSDLSDNPITKTTDKNGKIEFENLDATKAYWLKEIKAPQGYILDSKIIEVDFTKIQDYKLTVYNQKDPNAPPTDPDPPVDPDPPEGGGGSSGGGGGSSEKPTEPDKEYVLEYECNGGTFYGDETYSPDELVRLGKVPYRAGYVFTGWYADEELTELITDVTMTENKTVYAGWEIYTPSEMLNTDDHFAYIIGYPDGNVKPTGNITRAEVATIFFRLLEPTVREQNLTNKGSFSDVVSGMWHNIAISTVESLGIVKGYQYGNFAPDKPITRAELAAIATRFDNTNVTLYDSYSDISGHWAEDSIKRATSLGWVKGYPDGTFKPDEPITRAEAMTLINNVLLRLPEYKSDLLDGMIVWPDNTPDLWYYLAVQEATNSHDYRIKDKGIFEIWTKINPVEEWVKYQEKPIQKPTDKDNQENQDNDQYDKSDHLYGRFFF